MDFPTKAPRRIVQASFESDNPELRISAIEILAETAPELLLAERANDELVDQILFRKSAQDGTLYFPQAVYSPKTGSLLQFGRK